LIVVLLAVVSPASIAGALAAAAGTVVEALPFVAGSALLPRVRWLGFLPSLACGCGGVLPGALALPALALTWISFGPVVAGARAVAALLLVIIRLRRHRNESPDAAIERDPLGELAALAATSFAASLLAESLGAHPALAQSAGGALAALVLGAFVGCLAPCATAGIGAAIALRAADPWASFGLLATSGIVAFHVPSNTSTRVVSSDADGRRWNARLVYVALALACLSLWLRGTHGFLNPRFALVVPAGAVLATIAALRRTTTTRSRAPFLAPSVVLAALVFGSPSPPDSTATIPLDLYPGRRVEFTGRVAQSDASSTTLVRAAILCCRADARMLSLRLDRHVGAAQGSWVDVRGTVASAERGPALRVERLLHVSPPADPYLYL
jgi:hypothetical protein